jgi:ABC-type phosphate/phosphonate transport system ATPase subunit
MEKKIIHGEIIQGLSCAGKSSLFKHLSKLGWI